MISHQHILVVDDDQEDHLILLEYFKDCGKDKQVKFFRNGLEAINYLIDIPVDALLPKLIVLDLNMPILNGTQTLLEIKRNKRLKDIPVIIFSTSENENERRKCLSFGAEDYLVKPSTYSEGLKMIKKFTNYIP
jgi:CheY-like chemotaxis protein